jgi:hypothetical protein
MKARKRCGSPVRHPVRRFATCSRRNRFAGSPVRHANSAGVRGDFRSSPPHPLGRARGRRSTLDGVRTWRAEPGRGQAHMGDDGGASGTVFGGISSAGRRDLRTS